MGRSVTFLLGAIAFQFFVESRSASAGDAHAPAELDAYDVVWTTPGRDPSGSMPIGNGEVGANVWVDGDAGELDFYVSRTDSFSEASRLLKLGKVRVRVAPNPFAGRKFEQRLHLRSGALAVRAGEGDDAFELELFVDSDADVIHLTGRSARAVTVTAAAETWRTADRILTGDELASSWTMQNAPAGIEVRESADRTIPAGLFHRNATSVVELTLRQQGLADADGRFDPLLHRTFGLLLDGPGFSRDASDARSVLLQAGVRAFELHVAAPCLQCDRDVEWRDAAATLLKRADGTAAAARTAAWWDGFWARSWIFVRDDPSTGFAVPDNSHPLRIGFDEHGSNRFVGEITDVHVDPPAGPFDGGFRLRATVAQDPAHPVGRIFDKITAGGRDGFLLDTHPGHSLRLIVGERELVVENALPGGERHEVAARYDAKSGRMEILRDGRLLKASEPARSDPADPEPPSRLTRALLLQRWVEACGGRGDFPIKFNGSIFTVEPKYTGGPAFDADWRKWGDCYWWQNTRLPYHPMLAQGDFEMMAPLFRLYERVVPLCRARARIYHGVEGAYFPETMTPFGTYANQDYGWDRTGRAPRDVLCPYWRFAWNQGPELVALMLDRHDYARDPAFARDELLPMADAVLAWFDTRFPRDADGRLRITPTQSVETYWQGVENDMPSVAGLHDVVGRLLALPEELVGGERRERWRRLAAALPPIPTRTVAGVRMLAPAERYVDRRSNIETPELYAVFPFRRFGLGRADLELARAAYAARVDRATQGWTQDGEFAALLGLEEEARRNLLAKVRNGHPGHRFPVMWGPNFDWLPDQDHGSNLLEVAQCMLLQPVGRKLFVLPCWPAKWNVSFRLHAPLATVVECDWRDGEVRRLVVTPPERRADVVIGPPK